MRVAVVEQALQQCESVRNSMLQLLLDFTIFRLPGKLQGASESQCF